MVAINDAFGPFSVDPAQVTGLGGEQFQELINRLLAAEAADLSGVNLRTSYQANVGDRGVDAVLYAARETRWTPAGDSAWQFKAGDLSPASCAKELAGATRVHEILAQGGKYRLVLGKGLEDHLITNREKKLRAKAVELGLDASGDRIKVIDGNQLARWLEGYPALATSRVLGGVGNVAIGFDAWQLSQIHRTTWIDAPERKDLRTTILSLIGQSSRLDMRIEGASGIGKTRGTLEGLRGSKYEALVLYVGDADDLNYPLINHLMAQRRTAVLVIDECTRQRHKVFAEQLESGSSVRLITIGERDPSLTHARPIEVSVLPDEVIDKVLIENQPALWVEARRIVVANCAGNVRWALYLADAILDNPKASAGDLIGADGLREFVLGLLSGEGNLLAFSALALFSRYGIDGDKRAELELIATGLGIATEQLVDASRVLGQLGLLTKHGRYRSVTPQPLAVLLASRAWKELGTEILSTLLPSLDASMAERLFTRAADIGSTGPAAVALNRILDPDGPFGSLATIAETASSRMLIQLAIISPNEVATHLDGLISQASDEELYGLKTIRRDLVWTLEKLVWHRATFRTAADMLLRLAMSENETFSNNATGTWTGLFGATLPATAALPADRIAYLEQVAADRSAAVRKIVAAAADDALDSRGLVMVSGELQGGVVVEPRGIPTTYDELWAYVEAIIGLLRTLAANDSDDEVRNVATKALVGAIHPLLENVRVRETLFDALASLPAAARRLVWAEVEHLSALFDRVETPEFAAATNSSHDVAGRRAGLSLLVERLPAPDQIDKLKVLAGAHRWDWEDGELERRIVEAAQSMPVTDATRSILQLLAGPSPAEASYELGSALYAVAAGPDMLASLIGAADTGNIAAIVGYLYAAVKHGEAEAFDSLLDGELGMQLDAATRLTITARGPRTSSAQTRVVELQKVLPVHVGAPRLFGWPINLEDELISIIIADWLPRIDTQQDYNAAVDTSAMIVFRRPVLSAELASRIAEIVQLRAKFGEVRQQGRDWVQLALRGLPANAESLILSLLEQIDAGSLHLCNGSEEQDLLREAITSTGAATLDQVLGLVQGGSWRLRMDLRGWLADAYPASDVIAWIGEDLDRARLVASLTGVGDDSPSQTVQFLLSNFGSDERVSASLYGDFVSGFWVGNESDRLGRQISQLNGWLDDRYQPAGVREWARDAIASLKRRRDAVLEREAEENR